MTGSRRILTVHSPVPPAALDDLLTAVEAALQRSGATRIWIDARFVPELVVMAEFADEELEKPTVVGVGNEACGQVCGEVVPDLPAPRGA